MDCCSVCKMRNSEDIGPSPTAARVVSDECAAKIHKHLSLRFRLARPAHRIYWSWLMWMLQGVHRQITGQIRVGERHKISLFCVLHQMAALMVLVMFTIRRGLSCECGAWNGITRLNMYKKKAPRLFYCSVIVASRITKTLRQQRVVVFGAGRCGQHKTDAVNVHR